MQTHNSLLRILSALQQIKPDQGSLNFTYGVSKNIRALASLADTYNAKLSELRNPQIIAYEAERSELVGAAIGYVPDANDATAKLTQTEVNAGVAKLSTAELAALDAKIAELDAKYEAVLADNKKLAAEFEAWMNTVAEHEFYEISMKYVPEDLDRKVFLDIVDCIRE